MRAFAEILRASDYAEGCPVATVTLEAAARSAAIRAACDQAYAEWQRQIAAYLGAAGVPAARAASLATLVLAAAGGGLILSRARHDVEPLITVAAQLADLLRRAVAESGTRRRRRPDAKMEC